MDVVLQTHDPNATLAFKRITRCDNDFCCMLVVHSGGFSAEHQFCFSGDHLASFCSDIRAMDRNLDGEARLGHRYERDEVAFEMNKVGHVIVRGLLTELLPPEQQLRFVIRTDQTCLGRLARDFEAAAALLGAA